MNNFVIEVKNLSKSYNIYEKPSDRLKQLFLGNSKRKFYQDFWALKNISFDVKKGEAIGIVGENGAGKSTLLEIIAGTLPPTEGACEVNGKISALLELGSGFNPEFTGRENIYMGASILGLKQKEIEKKYREIIDFADIGEEFLERPVKTYSSGMLMRLAFSVSTCIEPDILIVDEALSVGDAIFQAKCYSRIREMLKKGISLLFVSHAIDTVQNICDRVLWLNHGKTELWDTASIVCDNYHNYCLKKRGVVFEPISETENKLPCPHEKQAMIWDTDIDIPKDIFQENPSFEKLALSGRRGTGAVRVKNVLLTDLKGRVKDNFQYNDEVILNFLFHVHQDVDTEFNIGVMIKNLKGTLILTISQGNEFKKLKAKAGQIFFSKYIFRLPLRNEDFYICTHAVGYKDGISIKNGCYVTEDVISFDLIEKTVFFKVAPYEKFPVMGPVQEHHNLDLKIIKVDTEK